MTKTDKLAQCLICGVLAKCTEQNWDVSEDKDGNCYSFREILMECNECDILPECYGGEENWTPTFSDPDSGGEPYLLKCPKCGKESIQCYEYTDSIKFWNKLNRKE